MKRDIHVSILNGIVAQRDAISNICLQTCEALKIFARDRELNLRFRVFTQVTDLDLSHVQVRRSIEELLGDPFFHQSDLIIYNYGIHYDLFDSLFLLPKHKRVLALFYAVTHPWLATDPGLRDCLALSHDRFRGLWLADRILCTSQFCRDELRRAGLPAERLARIPLPARTAAWSPGAWGGQSSRPVRFLYVGRLVRAKGLFDLIEALGILRRRGSDPVQLTLVGNSTFSSAEDISALRRLIQHHSLNGMVCWEQDVPGERLEQLYAESDAFVMPSYHEGFCMPLIEALSHGLPLLHSDRGAIPETSGGLGLTFAAGQPEKLADCLALFPQEFARAMVPTDRGTLARDEWLVRVSRHVEDFTFQSFCDALVPHLDDLLAPVPAQLKTYLATTWLDTLARAGKPEIQQARCLPPRFTKALTEAGVITTSVAGGELNKLFGPSRPDEASRLGKLKARIRRTPVIGAAAARLKRQLVQYPHLYNNLKGRADQALRLVDQASARLRQVHPNRGSGGLTHRLRLWAHALERTPILGKLARYARFAITTPMQIRKGRTELGQGMETLAQLIAQVERALDMEGRLKWLQESQGLQIAKLQGELKALLRKEIDRLNASFEELQHGLKNTQELMTILATKQMMTAQSVRELKELYERKDEIADPIILDQESYQSKLRLMKGKIRVNLGCGELPVSGYLNVDARALPGVDIVADVLKLPFAKGSLSEIMSAHLVEHFRERQVRDQILPYWKSLLKQDGMIRIICPDWADMLARLREGRMSYQDFRLVTFGGQDYEGDDHFNMYTTESMIQLLQEERFGEVTIVAQGRLNGLCSEMEIVAFKQAAETGSSNWAA